jgi:PKD repeat protein
MKFKLIFLFLVLIAASSRSQELQMCGTDILMQRRIENNTLAKEKRKLLEQKTPNNSSALLSYTIPIVFHVLHQNGPENISDEQVRDGLRILNEDFSKTNPDISQIIPSFNTIADSTKIRFVLPTLDPQGNCTNGIIHYYDSNTNWDADFSEYSYTWDPTRYLNIYLVKTINMGNGFSAAGYTYLPGSWPDGSSEDCIVMLNNYFGSFGTGNYFISRVLTHEIGHWLNLSHVFGGTNNAGVDCNGDDFVDDTPTTPGYLLCPDVNNPSSYQICTPGIDENFQNYMDYSYCCKMFTAGQGQRMREVLSSTVGGRNNLSEPENLAFTGVYNLQSNCVPEANFFVENNQTCVGAPVTFYDNSWNGTPQFYSWSFPGGNPSTSSEPNPIVTYSTPGVYSVTMLCGNNNGSSEPITYDNLITVIDNSAAQYSNQWQENFESNTIPGSNWRITNNSGGAQWELTSDVSISGSFCAKLPREFNFRYNVAELIGPTVNLSSITAPLLTFNVAAAEVFPEHVNTLKLLASADCEQTWVEIYSRTGQQLVTSSSNEPGFIPQGGSDWRTESVFLSDLADQENVTFKFVYYRDSLPQANNVFIEDINIGSPDMLLGKEPRNEVDVFPNPSTGSIFVSSNFNSVFMVELYDAKGALIKKIENNSSKRLKISEANELSKGIYFVKIVNAKYVSTKKIVVE